MKYFALSLLMLAACGPVKPAHDPYCVTSYGMRYMGLWSTGELIEEGKFTCEYFQTAQDKLIQSIGTTYDKDANIDTARLMGVEIWLVSVISWRDDYGRNVSGEAFCREGYMQINNDERAEWSSFPHETVHFLQNCYSPSPADPGQDLDHANWYRDGLNRAILDTQGL